ncbi:acetolactate synthase [Klebsiella pneumoniae]|uniref:Acetolactate synthase n=1 Tax=Klebsiella pneumoniae TaxID=573 RepID=A0A377X9X4_KLEPN|nr:acetolactate synthase [Klebsiella pneumoniae]
MFSPVTKYAVEVTAPDALAEVVSNAFRAAEQGRPGSAFVSLPQDVVDGPVSGKVLPASGAPQMGAAPDDAIDQVAKLIAQAKNPIFLLGLMASQPENSKALRRLLETSHIPVTSTYQAAGAVNQDNFSRFAGRVGLFNNQAGDRLLQLADLVICIGYSPVEYEPAMWNSGNATLVHIDVLPAYEERNYTPDVELVGDIAGTLNKLAQNIDHRLVLDRRGAQLNQFALHPLRIVRAMQDIVNSDVTLTVDMGSFHIWIARYLYSFRARQVMISNGQQTMGVALPWAIGAWLVNPERKVVSVSGDGGFLQSSMELETAVRLKPTCCILSGSITATTWSLSRKRKNTSACPASSSGRWILKPMPNPSARKGLPWKAPRRWSRPCARRWTSTARRWWPFRWIIAITRC